MPLDKKTLVLLEIAGWVVVGLGVVALLAGRQLLLASGLGGDLLGWAVARLPVPVTAAGFGLVVVAKFLRTRRQG